MHIGIIWNRHFLGSLSDPGSSISQLVFYIGISGAGP